jgi:hypothetical protein
MSVRRLVVEEEAHQAFALAASEELSPYAADPEPGLEIFGDGEPVG